MLKPKKANQTFQNNRWNEPNQMICAQVNQQQPELQLNINSQGGFVPSFISNSRSESNSSPKSDTSYNVCLDRMSRTEFEKNIF